MSDATSQPHPESTKQATELGGKATEAAHGSALDQCRSDAWAKGCTVQGDAGAQTHFDRQPKQLGEPIFNQRALTADDVKGMNPQMDAVLRNAMFAQYGRNFDNCGYAKLYELMGSQAYPDKSKNMSMELGISDLQEANAVFLRNQEGVPFSGSVDHKAQPEMSRRMGEPVVNQRALTDADLKDLNPTELSVLRNSVYAQYGYHFTAKPEIGQFFKALGAKEFPDASNNEKITLTPIQAFNVQFIADHEKALRDAAKPQ